MIGEDWSMTEHVTISLDAEHLERARREARRLGVSVESYLSRLVRGNLPTSAPAVPDKPHISAIFGIGASAEPTDVAGDKDVMVGEAVWKLYPRVRVYCCIAASEVMGQLPTSGPMPTSRFAFGSAYLRSAPLASSRFTMSGLRVQKRGVCPKLSRWFFGPMNRRSGRACSNGVMGQERAGHGFVFPWRSAA
jgi:hypothetical protein